MPAVDFSLLTGLTNNEKAANVRMIDFISLLFAQLTHKELHCLRIFARMLKEIATLVKKDIVLEFRQRYAFFSILLYVLATVYIAYLVFNRIDSAITWNALLWIILVFASLTTASKSFQNESDSRFLYYYQLCRPQALLLAKVIYNTLFIALVSLLTYFVYAWFLGNPVELKLQFILAMLLGSAGFSGILTVISAIAMRTNNNPTLLAILSIPLLLPIIIVVVRASIGALMGVEDTSLWTYIGALLALNALVVILGFLLFPYLWRD